MEIEWQFLSLSVITYSYCRLPVIVSLEKIICLPVNRSKKVIKNELATMKRWPRLLNEQRYQMKHFNEN